MTKTNQTFTFPPLDLYRSYRSSGMNPILAGVVSFGIAPIVAGTIYVCSAVAVTVGYVAVRATSAFDPDPPTFKPFRSVISSMWS